MPSIKINGAETDMSTVIGFAIGTLIKWGIWAGLAYMVLNAVFSEGTGCG